MTAARRRGLPCAGLLFCMAGAPATAQSGAEIEIGGGFHAALDLGSDWIALPSVPTVDARVTRWFNDRWGVAGRALVGFGSNRPDESGIRGHRHPSYFQALVRYRASKTEKTALHVGFGGGLIAFGDTFPDAEGRPVDDFTWGVHFLALEALVARKLTDRLGIRYGATAVVPLHVHAVVLAAWRL